MSAHSRLAALEGYLSVCEDVSREEGHEQAAVRFETARQEVSRVREGILLETEVPENCSCPEPYPIRPSPTVYEGRLFHHPLCGLYPRMRLSG